MNREIIFRGKRVDNGEWVYGCYQPFVGETEIMIFFDTSDKRNHKYEKVQINKHLIAETKMPDYQGWDYSSQIRYTDVKPETIGQYTGLTDKNGVKIFEGDYLRDDYSDDDGNVIESSVEVFWDNKNAQWAIDNSFKQDGSSLTNLIDYLGFDNLEVVSNG